MNYKYVHAVIAAAAIVPCASLAQSNVTLFGLLDAGVEVTNAGKGSTTRFVSGGDAASRWGVKGAEDLGGGWSTVFRLESAILLDTGGTAPTFWLRESSVGLSSRDYGTVTFGRTPTPYWMTSWVQDAFVWGTSGGFPAISRNDVTTQQLFPLLLNARVNNSISYVSPSLGGFEFRAQGALEDTAASIGRSYSVGVRYTRGPIDVAASWQQINSAGNGNGRVRGFAVGGNYDLQVAKVYAGYTDERNDCTTCTGTLARVTGVPAGAAGEFRLINLGVRVPIGAFTAIGQFARIQDRSQYAVSPGSRDANWITLGGEYALSKRTVLYGSAGWVGNRNGSRYALGSGAAQQPAGTVGDGDSSSTTMVLGLRHSF